MIFRNRSAGQSARALSALGSVAVLAAFPLIAPSTAQAQTVCGVSANGGEPQTGGLASAANANDFACGPNSQASGGAATAIGDGTFAHGANSVTVGFFSGTNIATAGVVSLGAGANNLAGGVGLYSTAIGSTANPSGAIGTQSFGNYSIAIGGGDRVGANPATSTGANSIAIGGSAFTASAATNGVALGFGATSSAASASAIGTGASGAGAFSSAFGSNAAANGANSVAIGGNTASGSGSAAFVNATSANGVAIGNQSRINAGSGNSTAVGFNNSVTGTNSGAFGSGQTVNGSGSYAFGDPNTINGSNSFVVGDGNTINGSNTAGNGNNVNVFGSSNNVANGASPFSGANSTVLGNNNVVASTANATGAAVFGVGNTVNAANAIAFGNNVTVTGSAGVAIGQSSAVSGNNATAIGPSSGASGTNSAAFGVSSQATAANATAIGPAASAGLVGTAVGSNTQANGTNSIAIGGNINNGAGVGGAFVDAAASNGIAIGTNAQVSSGTNAIALGVGSTASASGAVALGSGSVANVANTVSVGTVGGERKIVNVAAGSSATDAVNFGQLSALSTTVGNIPVAANNTSALATPSATGNNSLAVGWGSSATASNSVAVGAGSVAGVADTFSVGAIGSERRIVNVAPGTLSAASTDAVNGSQLFATNGNVSTLQTQINNGSIGLVQQSAAGQPITVGATTDGTEVNFAGTAGNRTLTGINRIGIGTTTPGLDLQITSGNTPAIRLEQNTSGGFPAQTWDIGANEANFFVRDMNSGNLSFRIRPGAPTNSITAAANGNVGLGTIDPTAKLHVFGAAGADTFANFGPSPAAGTTALATAVGSAGFNVGYGAGSLGAGTGFLNAYSATGTAGKLLFATDGVARMTLDSAGSIAIGTGSSATASGAAFGNGAQVTAANSVALGAGSLAGVANTVSVGASGSERRIVNLAAGTLSAGSTDAVNGSQLFATNNSVSALQNQIGNGSIGLVQQAGPGAPITVGATTDGAVVNFTGTAGTRKLTGVSAGAIAAASTDAINGDQFLTANQRVAAAFGGGAGLDANGQLVGPSYTIQGTAYNNVGSAFSAVDTKLTSTANNVTNLQNQINSGSIGLVQQDPATRAITVGAATDGASINVAGTAGNRTVTGVAAGALSATSTDAVNGSQLFATNQQVASLSSTVAGLSSSGNYVKVNGSGPAASAAGSNAVAIGSGSNASAANAVAMGTNAQATQAGAVAIGFNSASTGTNAIAIGTGATATGSVAVGAGASASNGGAAYGDGASATATNSTAIGPNSSATAANSVAVGSGSTNTVANTVSFGSGGAERRLTNVAAGISQTDAVNVGQLQSVAAGMQSQLGGLQNQINDNRWEARGGVALALAASGLRYDDRPGKLSVAGSFGNFKGESGLAFGVGYAATNRLRFNASVSGVPSQGSVGGVVGGSITLN